MTVRRQRAWTAPESGRRSGLWCAAAMAAMLIAGVVLIVSRRPDAISNPQFWAEDGKSWFADAYNLGARALLKSDEGYLSTLPRLVGAPVAGMSMTHAALVFNVVGIAVQVAPAVFFLSRRFEHVVRSSKVRAVVGLVYLLIPNPELNVTVTNAQWHLVILALMVLIAHPPRTIAAHVFDAAVLVMCGLTGPFAVVLLPAAIARAVTMPSHRRWYGALSVAVLITLLTQVTADVMRHRDHVQPLGASFSNAVTIFADRVVIPGVFMQNASRVYTTGSALGIAAAVAVSVAALGVIALALLRGGGPLRIIVLACLAITAFSLLSPIATQTNLPAWTSMARGNGYERYLWPAELAWLVCLIWAVAHIPRQPLRIAACASLAAAFAAGLAAAWAYPPYIDLHPASYSAQLEHAAPGTAVVIPINPATGGTPTSSWPGWSMTLTRK